MMLDLLHLDWLARKFWRRGDKEPRKFPDFWYHEDDLLWTKENPQPEVTGGG